MEEKGSAEMSIDSGDMKGKDSAEMSVDSIVEEFVTPPSSPSTSPPPPDSSNGWRGKITGVVGKITGVLGFGGWKSSQKSVEPQLHVVNTQCNQSNADKINQAPNAAELNTKKRKSKSLTPKSNTKFSPPCKKLKNSESTTDEVLNDNQHSSMSNMPLTSREELLNGQKVKDPWLISRCSLSLDEESTRAQCDKAIEDENVNWVDESVDKERFQIGIGTEHTGLMLFENTADIANVLDTVDQMERPYTKRFDTEVQPTCNILGKEEVAQDSLAIRAPSEQAVHATTVIVEECVNSSIIHLQCSQQTHIVQDPSGVSVDNQHSMTNMPLTSRDESLHGQKVQNPWHISRCSMSCNEEKSTRGQCDKATEDENVKRQSLFGNCVDEGIDKEHIQIGVGTEQAGLALIQNTADIGKVLNIVEQMEIPCPKRFDAEIQPTCNNLRKGEVAQDAFFIIAPSGQAVHASTTEGKEFGDSSIVHSNCLQQTHSAQDSSDPFREASTEGHEILHSLPDFQPLGQKGEFPPEGPAKGDMQNVVNVEDKASKAQFDEPKCNKEKSMIALIDMEANGYALQPLQTRAQDIHRAKDNQVQIDGELGQFDKEVIHEQHKDELLKSAADTEDEKVQSLEESLTQTKQQLILLSFEKQTKASSIAQLEKKIQETQEDLKNIKLEFERVATAPW